jgi:hypothetical protein
VQLLSFSSRNLFVTEQGLGLGVSDQALGAGQIVGLSGREHYIDGIAQGIDEDVNFGGYRPCCGRLRRMVNPPISIGGFSTIADCALRAF